VELYRRGEDDRWILTDYTDLEDQVPLESLDCTLVLAEIYDKVAPAQGNRIYRI